MDHSGAAQHPTQGKPTTPPGGRQMWGRPPDLWPPRRAPGKPLSRSCAAPIAVGRA